ncbi:MAG: hypothetical protein RIG82_13465 [Phycisphaeraceae bacterium]
MPRVTTLLLGIALVIITLITASPAAPPPDKIRIGVYDTRAIAIAYANSAEFQTVIREKKLEQQAAVQRNDTEEAQRLEAWGQTLQLKLHFQGFCRVPVSDILQPHKDQLNQIAAKLQLAAITSSCDLTVENTITVDITTELVKIFDPSEKTLEMTQSISEHQPLPLTDVANMPAHH